MSIFGPREDDPLLQNDPLAPSSDADDESAVEDSTSDTPLQSSSTRDTSASEASSPPSKAGDANESVFSSPHSSVKHDTPDHQNTRTLTYVLNDAIDGRLTALSEALSQGWRLTHVEVRQKDVIEEESKDTTRTLAFILHSLPSA